MTRCVFLSHSAADSGAEQSVVLTLSAWNQQRDRPLIVLSEDGPIVDRAGRLGVETLVVPLGRATQGLRRSDRNPGRILSSVIHLVGHSSRILSVVRERQADIVVAISIKALVFGWIAGRRSGAKVVWNLHDRISADYFPWYVVPMLRHVAPRLVDAVIVNSESTLSTVRLGRTPALVSYPAVALDGRQFTAPSDPVRSVVMTGRLAPWKGQDIFLRAFARAFGGSEVRAKIVGGALFGETEYAKSLVDLAAALGIEEQVDFTGHVADVWPHLVDADIVVHCSRTPEPFGQVVVEGMWARCAVVATSPGGPAEIITHGEDGLLAPCDDEDSLVMALVTLREDGDLRRHLAERGREVAARFGALEGSSRMQRWLDRLVAGQLAAATVTRPRDDRAGSAGTPEE